MNEQTARIGTEEARAPLEVEGMELLSDEGLNELRQWVEQEIMRRRERVEVPK